MKNPSRPELSFLIEALHLSPNEFFDAFYEKHRSHSYKDVLNRTVLELTKRKVNFQELSNYNTEIVEAWDAFVREKQWQVVGDKCQSVFEFVRKFSNECLLLQSREPYFRIEALEAWQNVTLHCGEDLFVAALYADRSIQQGSEPSCFQWNYILKSNYFTLNNLLGQKKLVENHYHLGGSSPNVDLSWIYLMNNPWNQDEKFEGLYKAKASFYPSSDSYLSSEQSDLLTLVQIAAYIRMWLFQKCVLRKTPDVMAETMLESVRKTINSDVLVQIIQNDSNEANDTELNHQIAFYKFESPCVLFGEKVDYAIRCGLYEAKERNSSLAGERHLMYACLFHIFSCHYDDWVVQFFLYFYLLIKHRFNEVFIQSNNKTGFRNFKEYTDRKSYFIKNTVYEKIAKNMAVEGNIRENNLEQLELRIAPYSKEEDLIGTIQSIESKAFMRPQTVTLTDRVFPHGVQEDKTCWNKDLNGKYFYVLHFIKPEKSTWGIKEENKFAPKCREYEKRVLYREQAECFMRMRKRGEKVCEKIFGIDAASCEVNFRPENFGTVFRYLSAPLLGQNEPWKKKMPDLHKTYHVGEDFYDVVDGLRAIDEAVMFLELSHGDRIGHGVALGIDVVKWYQRHPVVMLPLQNKVDNLGWILYKIREWNIDISTANYHKLNTEFKLACRELYEQNLLDLLTYSKAWRMRGDDPQCYSAQEFEEKWLHPATPWERYSIRELSLYEETKSNQELYGLCHRYHYDLELKQRASKYVRFTFEPFYVDLVKQLQIRMRSYMLEKGVAIESCPTSNFLISNVDEFSEIPTFQLFPIRESHSDFIRLNVSINTDDQGVFYTSLTKEYSLLAGTLRLQKENGLRLYSDDKIMNWVEHIIENGKQQCFGDDYKNDGL